VCLLPKQVFVLLRVLAMALLSNGPACILFGSMRTRVSASCMATTMTPLTAGQLDAASLHAMRTSAQKFLSSSTARMACMLLVGVMFGAMLQ
jgi:hypothetical protein